MDTTLTAEEAAAIAELATAVGKPFELVVADYLVERETQRRAVPLALEQEEA